MRDGLGGVCSSCGIVVPDVYECPRRDVVRTAGWVCSFLLMAGVAACPFVSVVASAATNTSRVCSTHRWTHRWCDVAVYSFYFRCWCEYLCPLLRTCGSQWVFLCTASLRKDGSHWVTFAPFLRLAIFSCVPDCDLCGRPASAVVVRWSNPSLSH